MKKYLALVAFFATFGTVAQAQNVSLYGALDAGVYAIDNANNTGKNTTSFVDSSLQASLWGIRGSEDLGGGLRAVFNLEGDVQTNNGGLNQNGLFRRAANVGLAGSFGQVDLGLRVNPFIAAHGGLLPLSGMSVATNTAVSLKYADFYTRNAVTYTSPTIMGLTAQLQYGAANTTGETANGQVIAGSINYTLKDLTLIAAMQDRNAGGGASSANGTAGAKRTNLVGARYKLGNLSVGAGRVENDNAGVKVAANQVGASYQMTKAIAIGANYVKSDNDSSLANVQARYALSNRTTMYVQAGRAENGTTTHAFQPMFATTGNSPAVNVGGLAAAAETTQTAVGVGLVHRF